MLILTWPPVAARPPGVALVFGTGLIGSAVVDALRRATGAVAQAFPWPWQEDCASEARLVEAAAVQFLAALPGARLSLIWAAGRGGFGSDAEAMAGEALALEAVLKTGQRILDAAPGTLGAFHHVSSAGGLFEGQTACGPDAVPKPLRPYGFG